MRKFLTLFTILVFYTVLAIAQTKEVTGTVTDSKGAPIPGATIKIKGIKSGMSSDADGNFKVKVSAGQTLIFSGIGFAPKEVTIGGQTTYTVAMQRTDANLSEVVVTALGIRRDKRLLTYSQQEVKGAALVEAKQDNLVNALAGKVAGVQITNSTGMPGSSTRITIRGTSSLTGENQALFVIDGIPMDNGSAGNPDGSLEGGNTANRGADIDPNIIESITVLKGAAATALYGSSAARGAVLITTKNGHGLNGSGKPNISVSSSYSNANPNYPELQHTYAEGTNGQYYDGSAADQSATSYGPRLDTLRVNGQRVPVHNQLKEFFKTGHTIDNNVSVSGFSDKSNYLVSYSYLNTDGIEPTTNYNRHSFFVKYSTRLLNNLTVSTQINYVHSGNNRLVEGNGFSNPLWTVFAAPITYDLQPYLNQDGTQRLYRTGRNNPYWLVQNTGLRDVVDRVIPVLNVNYNPLSWLSLTERLGGDIYFNTTGYHENVGIIATATAGRMYIRDNQNKWFNHDFIIDAKKDLSNKLSGDLVLGNNIISKYNSSNTVDGANFSIPGFYNISNASNVTSSYNINNVRKVGFYAQATLEYDKMLTLNLTGREDGSSVLSQTKQFYPYGSASLGFIVTEALGMSTNPILNFGKLRVSYSSVGNDNVQPYSLTIPYSQPAIGNIAYPLNTGPNGLQLSSTYASPLQNESLKEFETGFETKWLNNRVSLDVTYFDRRNTKLLTGSSPLAPATGFNSQSLNAGNMYNKGIEVVVGGTPIRTRNLTWDISVNFTRIRNKVTYLAANVPYLQFAGFTDPAIDAFAGSSYGVIYGSRYMRDTKTNELLLANGYPQKDPNAGTIGNVTPDWLAGMTNTLTYKGFSLSFTLDMKQGGQILNLDEHYLDAYGMSKASEARGTTTTFKGIDQATGKENITPVVLTQSYFMSIRYNVSETAVQNASYLKLRQASLGYNFNNSLVKGSAFKNLTLTVTGTNFILHKTYTGSDPEASLDNGNGQGLTNWVVPTSHNIIVGLKANF